MLTLINTNRMSPPIAPIGLEYVASAAEQAGIPVDILDLGLVSEPEQALTDYFATHAPALVGLSFRNIDDCFWPSCQFFGDTLKDMVRSIKTKCDAPVVGGGTGFSLFPRQLVDHAHLDFGIHGDGEAALVSLYRNEARSGIPGLIWRQDGQLITNPPAWPATLNWTSPRDRIDNRTYFARGGQIGFETKRGCNRHCTYCPDPLAKGTQVRLRSPAIVGDEIAALIDQGIDVLHTCDAEFNVPGEHARAVCRDIIKRGLGERMRWYAYLSVVPFDAELAALLRQAGCVGIDFTTDSAHPAMLQTYRQPYSRKEIARAVTLCRSHDMAVMMDMLTGGPGETPETLADTIAFMKEVAPDGVGCGMGIRLYPGTTITSQIEAQGPWEENPGVHRKHSGPVDLFYPTFYISPALGPNPGRLVREMIDGDPRFFEPMEDVESDGGHGDSRDHNYNANTELTDAIAQGERGAYWHIMLKLRGVL